MKFLLQVLFIFSTSYVMAQVTASAPTGDAGLFANAQGGSPMLNLVMMDIRTRRNINQYEGETVGSPYYTENFIKSKVFYGDEALGDFYVRYNALNSEIEIKKSILEEEEPKRLLADKKIRVKYQNRELRFTTYITKKNETKNGYLTQLVDGKKYNLFHRLAVKYSEGKAAANSMVNDIPSRYAHFDEYYYQAVGVNRIDQLSPKKGKFLKRLNKEDKEKAELFIKEQKIDLSKEADLIRIFEHLNS